MMRMFMFVFMNKVAILGSALDVADSTIRSGSPSLDASRFDWHIGSPDLFTQSPFKGQRLWLINSSNPCLIHKIARADPGSVIMGAHVVTNLKKITVATCAYLTLIALAGLAIHAAFHAAWFNSVAALVAVAILMKEGRSAWKVMPADVAESLILKLHHYRVLRYCRYSLNKCEAWVTAAPARIAATTMAAFVNIASFAPA
jgi:hypothetical protein